MVSAVSRGSGSSTRTLLFGRESGSRDAIQTGGAKVSFGRGVIRTRLTPSRRPSS